MNSYDSIRQPLNCPHNSIELSKCRQNKHNGQIDYFPFQKETFETLNNKETTGLKKLSGNLIYACGVIGSELRISKGIS